MIKKLARKIKSVWMELGKSIYVGKRLEENLKALTYVSSFTIGLGIVLLIMNLKSGNITMLAASAATIIGGVGCAFTAGILKKREVAILFPVIFCMVAFTFYTLMGAGNGYAALWALLLPTGISYFVSVKYGILLSIYYIILFAVVFYTPLGAKVAVLYNPDFISRFPLLYASMAGFTAIAMIQYHRSSLLEIDYTNKLNSEVEKQTKVATERADRLQVLNEEMVQTLAVTIDAKDKYTNGHSFRVSRYSSALAKKLGWPDAEVKELEREALLHDIGKIGVPDNVLNKPGRLTDSEFEIIKSHTIVGDNILSGSESLLSAASVARSHHERYDGKGYPDGKAGSDIPSHARIVSIADAYDAMHSDRIYRKGLPDDVIYGELVKGRGTQFDPGYVDAFIELVQSGELDE